MGLAVAAQEAKLDTGLAALVLLIRFHGIAADPAQLSHRFGRTRFTTTEMLRAARELKLKARLATPSWRRLQAVPLPAIAERKDGSFFILGKVADDKVLIQDPAAGRPGLLARDAFEAQWSGQLILMTRRASLTALPAASTLPGSCRP